MATGYVDTPIYTCDSTWQGVVRLKELKEDREMLGREEGRGGIDRWEKEEGRRGGGRLERGYGGRSDVNN